MEETGKCGKAESARRAEKDIKGVAFRVDKMHSPSSLVYSNSAVYRTTSELLEQLNTNDPGQRNYCSLKYFPASTRTVVLLQKGKVVGM